MIIFFSYRNKQKYGCNLLNLCYNHDTKSSCRREEVSFVAEIEKRLEKRIARRKIKDTVFSKLFEDYDNLLLLYKALYPEDTDVTTDDLHEVLLENMLLNGLYNDLSFTVRDKFIVLLEAQSTWTQNILPRSLIYYANLLNDHIKRTKQNIYGTRKVKIPRPDIYVV